MLRRIGVVLIIVAVLMVMVASLAHASTPTLTGGNHGCTDTNPEYVVSDVNATVHYTPGSVKFTSVHSPSYNWEDTYLLTGYNRGSNAVVLCGHYGSEFAYQLPFSATAPVKLKSTMTYTSSSFGGRIGWDLWLVRNGEQFKETTASAMEADSRTVEVMVSRGTYNHVVTVNGRWHRVYIGGGSMHNVDLGLLMRTAMKHAGVSPSRYQWEVIGAGAEFLRGTFSLTGYALSINTTATKTRSSTATASYTARHGLFAITATRHATAVITKTVTLPVKGNPLTVQQAIAASSASTRALLVARALAPSKALSEARRAATGAMYDKLHPYAVLPHLVHKRLGTAIATLRRDRFRNLSWTRGLKPSAVVFWEAGHPGHLTAVKAHIILRARR